MFCRLLMAYLILYIFLTGNTDAILMESLSTKLISKSGSMALIHSFKLRNESIMQETICLQCGDKGFTNAFVYCVKCLQFAVHR